MLAHGVRFGVFSGDIRDLWKDVNVLQPTIICGVPRVFTRLVESIERYIAQLSAPRRRLMNWAIIKDMQPER
jgi:long-subunit acyl-CoA synthetase (AMP-forming)